MQSLEEEHVAYIPLLMPTSNKKLASETEQERKKKTTKDDYRHGQ
jgi:hypothetical protein